MSAPLEFAEVSDIMKTLHECRDEVDAAFAPKFKALAWDQPRWREREAELRHSHREQRAIFERELSRLFELHVRPMLVSPSPLQ